MSQEEPCEARRSQEKPGGARRTQQKPVGGPRAWGLVKAKQVAALTIVPFNRLGSVKARLF